MDAVVCAIRASKPGSLLSVVPCKSFGVRPQVEFKGKKQTAWAMIAITSEKAAVALIDHEGRMVAKSVTYPS